MMVNQQQQTNEQTGSDNPSLHNYNQDQASRWGQRIRYNICIWEAYIYICMSIHLHPLLNLSISVDSKFRNLILILINSVKHPTNQPRIWFKNQLFLLLVVLFLF